MSDATFTVQCFDMTDFGLAIGRSISSRSAEEALRTAAALVPTKVGAAAVQSLCDPETGARVSVTVLGRFGDVPADYLAGERS